MRFFITLILLSISFSSFSNEETMNNDGDKYILLNYSTFGIKYNCTKRGFDYFMYNTIPDSGDNPRVEPFYQEQRLPEECRQFTTNTYKTPMGIQKFDRGHGVHQNIWDHDPEIMKQTNVFSNIVPHSRYLNQHGLWRHLEKVTECFRDTNDLHVVGGNIWGNDASNDYFLKSHGVVTPDYLFKIIVINDKDVFAFKIPNTDEPTYYNGTNYLTTVSQIESDLGYSLPSIKDELKNIKERYVPRTPKSCSIK